MSYVPVNGLNVGSAPTSYTVQDGDTLQSIAQAIWGDANFWYLIADANGLNSSDTLAAGSTLVIPNQVANADNNSSTFRVYDPNSELGNVSPTHPPRPQPQNSGGGCGVIGEILLAVVAVAVSFVTAGAALGALGVSGGVFGASASAVGTALGATAGTLGASVLGTAGLIGIGAVAGAVGSAVSQGIGLATGLQSKFNWAGVAEAAIGGAVGGAVGASGLFGQGGALATGSAFLNGAFRGVLSDALGQGLDVATGLQSKFNWAEVAGAGVGGGVLSETGAELQQNAGIANALGTTGINIVSGVAGDIANAATVSLISGTDFGDNILRALPDTIGATIGNAIAGEIDQASNTAGQDARVANGPPRSLVDNLGQGADNSDLTEFQGYNDAQVQFSDLSGGGNGTSDVPIPMPRPDQPGDIETIIVTGTRIPQAASDTADPFAATGGRDPQGLVSALYDTAKGLLGAGIDVVEGAVNLVSGAVPGSADYDPFLGGLRPKYDTPLYGGIIETVFSLGAPKLLGEFGGASRVVSEESSANQVDAVEEANRPQPLSSFQNADGTLVNADQAIMDQSKFTNYALDPNNPKSVVFKSALGYDQSNAADLMNQIGDVFPDTPATFNRMTDYGPRYQADLPITGANGNTAAVTTIWQYDTGSTVPRLITLWVK